MNASTDQRINEYHFEVIRDGIEDSWWGCVYDEEWNPIVDFCKPTYSAAYNAAVRWINKQKKSAK